MPDGSVHLLIYPWETQIGREAAPWALPGRTVALPRRNVPLVGALLSSQLASQWGGLGLYW